MRAFSVLRPAFLRGVLRFGFQVELERYKLHQLVIGLSARPKCETIVGRDAAAVWLAVAIPRSACGPRTCLHEGPIARNLAVRH
jgi:hypothetical protein